MKKLEERKVKLNSNETCTCIKKRTNIIPSRVLLCMYRITVKQRSFKQKSI